MFLLHINSSNKFFKKNMLHVQQLNFLKKKLKNKIEFLNLLKENKRTKNLSLTLKKNRILENSLKYIIGVSLSNTNTNFYITDIKGNIKYFSSAGFLNLNGNQKIRKPAVLIKLLRLIISKTKFIGNASIALHLKNFTEFYVYLILTLIKKYFVVKHVRVYNNKPHNGCRPRKLKRKKRRKLFFK